MSMNDLLNGGKLSYIIPTIYGSVPMKPNILSEHDLAEINAITVNKMIDRLEKESERLSREINTPFRDFLPSCEVSYKNGVISGLNKAIDLLSQK